MAPNIHVAIVGGGVCGLACAIALLNEGVDVHVYEAAVRMFPFVLTLHLTIRRISAGKIR